MGSFTGIALKLTSVLLFIIMASLIKATTDDVPTGQAVFFRSFFALPAIVLWLVQRGELKTGLRTARPMMHVVRGLVGVSAMGCGFASLGYLPLPEVTAIGFTAPLLTVLLAAVLLGERLRAFRMTAVFIGLVGVFIILSPRLTVFSADTFDAGIRIGVILVLLSAALRAFVQIHVRKMAATEETAAIVFYFSMTASFMGLCTLPFGWVMPEWHVIGYLVAAGLVGGVAQIFVTSAYKYSGAALLAPFDYASILFALLIGYFVFAEVPTLQMLLGSAVVIAAGILIIWRERQLGLQRGKARPNVTPQG
jgi:drug/metabolite transporter (DMT)-like permease